jgi:branched-chain amino acid transport system substrate-binding protein
MKIRGWQRSFALASTLAVVLGIGGTAAQARPTASASTQATATIKVGIVYSRTGAFSAYGAQYIQGLKLGLEYATKGTNTVGGKKIELTVVDDATDAAKAVTAAKDLIGQGYKIIGGSVSSAAALAVAPLAAQNQVLFISGPAANDGVTGANRYTFRSGRQTQQDVLTAKEILGKGVGKRITVFAQDSAFGQGNVAAVRTLIGGKGHTVNSILVPGSAQDFTPFAQQAKQARPDLLFVAWAGTTANAMWTALQQQGVMNDVTVSTGLAERATWSSFPPGINFLSHYVAEAANNKVNDWLVAKMKRRNQKPDLFTPDGFNAALMIVRAVQKGGGENVDQMISALEGYQFVGPKGVNRIRQQDHALIQPMFSAKVRQVNGKWQAFQTKVYSPGNIQPPIRPFPTN